MLLGGIIATVIVLSGHRFCHAGVDHLRAENVYPVAAWCWPYIWPKTNTVGFVGGVIDAIGIGMPIYETAGELPGTLFNRRNGRNSPYWSAD